jgi:hypothetical protein
MKIYLVWDNAQSEHGDSSEVLGVFTDHQKATEFAAQANQHYLYAGRIYIEEWEPNSTAQRRPA